MRKPFNAMNWRGIQSGLRQKTTPARVLVLTFALTIFVGSGLLALPIATRSGIATSYIDALFTATAATCVTGLAVVDIGSHYSYFGQGIILLLIQIGGLGFMTMATLTAIILGRKITLRDRLVMKEALNTVHVQGVIGLVRTIFYMTLIIEFTGAILLGLRWVPTFGWAQGAFLAVFHSIAAFCNAGIDTFGPLNEPFGGLTLFVSDPYVCLVIPLLIILGGLGFYVIVEVLQQRRFRKLSLHSKLVLVITGSLIGVGALGIYFLEYNQSMAGMGQGTRILASWFQSVTRTAGYHTLDLTQFFGATQFLLIILMFIGASPGGTGGGIKTTTFGTLFLGVWSIITGKQDVNAFGKRIPLVLVLKSLAVVAVSLTLIIVVTMILTITEDADFLPILFESVSASSTVGLSLGLTPNLTDGGRMVIAFAMFAGRIGPLTMALAIWQRQRLRRYRYPEEKIMIG